VHGKREKFVRENQGGITMIVVIANKNLKSAQSGVKF
jgi:hypothetical protein